MVLGPVWPIAASAARMLEYVPPLPPGQPTVTFAAWAIAGSRKNVSKIADTEAPNTRFFLMAMLLSFFDNSAGSPYFAGEHELSHGDRHLAWA